MVGKIVVAGRTVGAGERCFIIAEAGVNHNGDLGLARELVRVAAECGADAVKFQTFRADALATSAAPKASYQKRSEAGDESQQAMLRRLELSAAAHHELLALAQQLGILFLSSPFDLESAEFLRSLAVPCLKIPSGEITNLPFLRQVAAMDIPLILSTGMANLAEVRAAVDAIGASGHVPLALLHCVSSYPAEPKDCNLRALATLADAFRVPVGFSDHTEGATIALAAVALGACIVEKHFTVDRNLPGPDHQASLDPGQLRSFIASIRQVEVALGDGVKVPVPGERETMAVARKSLVAAVDVAAGTRLESRMLAARRPGTGISPARLEEVLGRITRAPLRAGELLTLEDLR